MVAKRHNSALQRPEYLRSSRAEESHPHPLLEPDVNVAIHPAPGVQPCFKCPVREEPELLGSNPLQPLVRPFPGCS